MRHVLPLLFLTACAGPPASELATQSALGGKSSAVRRVFVESNDAAANVVLAYPQAADGSFGAPVSYPTGGTGTGAALGSQGALALSADGSTLLAVNAGSDDVSVFAVKPHGLVLLDRQPSGGAQPVSVAISGTLVFVVNAGGGGSVAGFQLDGSGRLTDIGDALQPLSQTGAGAAQVSIAPDRKTVVVTEKATGCIDVFPLHKSGALDAATCVPSSGQTPFGFAFASGVDIGGHVADRLLVSEAFGGAANASAVSSYLLEGQTLDLVSPSVSTHQTAACWVAVSGNRFAYTTDTGSDAITGYTLSHAGDLTPLDADGLTATLDAGSKPADMAIPAKGHVLEVLAGGTHELYSLAIGSNGSLTRLAAALDVPAAAAGLVAE